MNNKFTFNPQNLCAKESVACISIFITYKIKVIYLIRIWAVLNLTFLMVDLVLFWGRLKSTDCELMLFYICKLVGYDRYELGLSKREFV